MQPPQTPVSTSSSVDEHGTLYRVAGDNMLKSRLVASRTSVKPSSGKQDSANTSVDTVTLPPRKDTGRRGSEITLSLTGILVLVLLLVIICGAFFLYGYGVGRDSSQAANAASGNPSDPNFGSFKPSPGSPVMQAVAGYDANGNPIGSNPASTASDAEEKAAASEPGNTVEAATTPDSTTPSQPTAPQPIASQPNTAEPSSDMHAATLPVAAPVAVSASAIIATPQPVAPTIVQVAAISHAEDADLLVSALHNRGYDAVAVTNPLDHLIHVQLGPFSNRKDAEAMKQRLLADGYNAILR
jgi:cell division septation protein DedD